MDLPFYIKLLLCPGMSEVDCHKAIDSIFDTIEQQEIALLKEEQKVASVVVKLLLNAKKAYLKKEQKDGGG
jgi:hypothetical protein